LWEQGSHYLYVTLLLLPFVVGWHLQWRQRSER